MKAFLILAGTALAFATPAAAQELVINGGFETGDFSGFTQTGNIGFTSVTNTSPYVASGSFGAAFGPVGSLGGITQTLATTAGQNYLIQFDLLNQGGTPTLYFVGFGAAPLFGVSDSSAFGFTTFSTIATATGGSTELSFLFQQDPSFFGLDNISVTAVNGAVPEPATWAMMLMGFGAMGFALRRRRRKNNQLQAA